MSREELSHLSLQVLYSRTLCRRAKIHLYRSLHIINIFIDEFLRHSFVRRERTIQITRLFPFVLFLEVLIEFCSCLYLWKLCELFENRCIAVLYYFKLTFPTFRRIAFQENLSIFHKKRNLFSEMVISGRQINHTYVHAYTQAYTCIYKNINDVILSNRI